MILLALVLIAPSIYGFYFSLFDIKYMKATTFIGFENYVYLFTDPEFIDVVVRSFVFTALAVALDVSVALAVALWINQLSGWFALFIQIIVISALGGVACRGRAAVPLGVRHGSRARRLHRRTTRLSKFQPLGDRRVAMVVLILYALWRTLGFAVLLLLSGIKSIPVDLYEAAHVDGARPGSASRRSRCRC